MITLRRLGRVPREAIAGALIALPVFNTVELSRIRGRRKLVTGTELDDILQSVAPHKEKP